MRISDWSSDVCSSDLRAGHEVALGHADAVLARQRAAERERQCEQPRQRGLRAHGLRGVVRVEQAVGVQVAVAGVAEGDDRQVELRSEEHTSELQSLMRISYAVFCLKKKKNHISNTPQNTTQSLD